MNQFIKQVFILSLIVFVSFSCKKETCDSKKIGEIPPPENYYEYVIHDKGEVVKYEDEEGNELSFRIDTLNWNGRINFDKIGEEETAQDGNFFCYEYKTTSWNIIQFEDMGDEEYTLQIQVRPIGETEDMVEYILEIFSGWIVRDPIQITGGSSGDYNVTREESIQENSNVIFEKLNVWEENGKIFNDVLSFANDTDEIYFVAGIGIVGFTGIDGVLFTIIQ